MARSSLGHFAWQLQWFGADRVFDGEQQANFYGLASSQLLALKDGLCSAQVGFCVRVQSIQYLRTTASVVLCVCLLEPLHMVVMGAQGVSLIMNAERQACHLTLLLVNVA